MVGLPQIVGFGAWIFLCFVFGVGILGFGVPGLGSSTGSSDFSDEGFGFRDLGFRMEASYRTQGLGGGRMGEESWLV